MKTSVSIVQSLSLPTLSCIPIKYSKIDILLLLFTSQNSHEHTATTQ